MFLYQQVLTCKPGHEGALRASVTETLTAAMPHLTADGTRWSAYQLRAGGAGAAVALVAVAEGLEAFAAAGRSADADPARAASAAMHREHVASSVTHLDRIVVSNRAASGSASKYLYVVSGTVRHGGMGAAAQLNAQCATRMLHLGAESSAVTVRIAGTYGLLSVGAGFATPLGFQSSLDAWRDDAEAARLVQELAPMMVEGAGASTLWELIA